MPLNTQPSILHICKVYLPVKGGIQKVVHAIAKLTDSYHHKVATCGEDGAIFEQNMDGVQVTRARSYLEIASMPIAPSLIKVIRHQVRNSDAVCLHYPFPLADCALATIIKLPPLVVYWHSNIVAQKKLKWLTYPFIFLTLRRAAVIVVTSQNMIDNSALLKRFQNKVQIIPYGLPPATQTTHSKNKGYFLLIGRHVSYKGIDVALRATKSTNSALILAGDGPLYEQHKLLAEELEISDRITFIKGATDNQLEQLISESIGLIVPSIMHNEAFALVQLEAMRLAKPVVNTALPSTVPSVARHRREGLTVAPRDVSELATAMNELANDSSLAKKLGKNGLSRYHKHYTSEKFGSALSALFAKLIVNETS